MLSNLSVFVCLSLLCSVLAAPAPVAPSHLLHNVRRAVGGTTGRYLVAFTPNCTSLDSWDTRLSALNTSEYNKWDVGGWGFSARLEEADLTKLRANEEVLYIEEDGFVYASQDNGVTVQTGARWGLERLSQKAALENQNASSNQFTYTFPSTAGQGVDVFVIDTGILIDHVEFAGRARTATPRGSLLGTVDGVGHGTHVAATIGGVITGVAKNANIIAIKALSDDGSGSQSDIIAAIDLAAQTARESRNPSVINMSLGGPPSQSIDAAVARAAAGGVHVVVAAGNENADARTSSPARSNAVITVGATDIADNMADFSNFGPAVDIFAPGVDIFSAGIANERSGAVLSGTSMASPHVAGMVAILISEQGNASPNVIKQRLLTSSVAGAVRGIARQTSNVLLNL